MSRQWQLNEQIISNTDYIHPYTSIYRIVPMQHVLDTSHCRGVTVPANFATSFSVIWEMYVKIHV